MATTLAMQQMNLALTQRHSMSPLLVRLEHLFAMKNDFFFQVELAKRAKMLKCHFTIIFMLWKTFRVNVSKYQIYEATEIKKSTYLTCINGYKVESLYVCII